MKDIYDEYLRTDYSLMNLKKFVIRVGVKITDF